MNIPSDLRYTNDHEWIRVAGDSGSVGITDYAQGELGDIVFLDLPAVGTSVTAGKPFGAIEAVKAASDLFAPVSGTIIEINSDLEQKPDMINQDAFGGGWIAKIKLSNPGELNDLLDAAAYGKLVEQSKGEHH